MGPLDCGPRYRRTDRLDPGADSTGGTKRRRYSKIVPAEGHQNAGFDMAPAAQAPACPLMHIGRQEAKRNRRREISPTFSPLPYHRNIRAIPIRRVLPAVLVVI